MVSETMSKLDGHIYLHDHLIICHLATMPKAQASQLHYAFSLHLFNKQVPIDNMSFNVSHILALYKILRLTASGLQTGRHGRANRRV